MATIGTFTKNENGAGFTGSVKILKRATSSGESSIFDGVFMSIPLPISTATGNARRAGARGY